MTAELPKGAQVLQACSHGTAQWTRAARIDIVSVDGTPSSFFLKVWGLPVLASNVTELHASVQRTKWARQ
jgi:hypothetical protein